MNKKMIHAAAFVLLVIGGLNMGLEALGFDVLYMVFGSVPMVGKVIALLIGLAAVYEVVTHKKGCRQCSVETSGDMTH